MTREKVLKKSTKTVFSIFRAILLVEVGFILLYPILYMISMAFRPVSQILDVNVIWIPKSLTLDNIKDVFAFVDYPRSFLNTIQIDLISAVLQTAVCCMAGYGFARFKFREKKVLFFFVIFTIIVPPQTTFISSYLQFRSFDILGIVALFNKITGAGMQIKLLDTPLAFYFPAALGQGIRAGLFIFIYRQFFRNMPIELEDAAHIDGCGPMKCFLRIMIPNAGAPIITTFLFSLVWYWNDTYFSGLYLETNRTISLSLRFLYDNINMMDVLGGTRDPFRIVLLLQAGALLTIIPLLLIYIILQKFFTESIERTGIVG